MRFHTPKGLEIVLCCLMALQAPDGDSQMTGLGRKAIAVSSTLEWRL